MRCLVGAGAGAAAIGTPLIDTLGMGWMSVLIAGIWTVFAPLLW